MHQIDGGARFFRGKGGYGGKASDWEGIFRLMLVKVAFPLFNFGIQKVTELLNGIAFPYALWRRFCKYVTNLETWAKNVILA